MNTKQKLIEAIDYFDENQVELIYKLLNVLSQEIVSKGDLMKLAFENEELRKIDSAIPMDYVETIREIHPNFNTQHHAFSYIDSYGELVNVSEKLVEKLTVIFNQ